MIRRDTDIKSALRSRQRGFMLNPFRFGGGGGEDPATDPVWGRTRALLHFNDPTLEDDSAYGTPFTSYESAATSTTKKLYGARSLRLPGSSFVYRNVGEGDFIGLQQFGIELSFNSDAALNSSTSVARLSGVFQSGNYSWVFDYTGELGLRFYVATGPSNAAPALNLFSGVSFAADTWNNAAVFGDSSNVYLFANGVLLATGDRPDIPETGNILAVGGSNSSEPGESFVGYIDEYRFTVGPGACRYTSDYTPRSSAFPNS